MRLARDENLTPPQRRRRARDRQQLFGLALIAISVGVAWGAVAFLALVGVALLLLGELDDNPRR